MEPNISAEIYGIFLICFPSSDSIVPVLTCGYSSHKFNGHWQFLGSVFEGDGGSHIFAYIISNSPVLRIKAYSKIRKKYPLIWGWFNPQFAIQTADGTEMKFLLLQY